MTDPAAPVPDGKDVPRAPGSMVLRWVGALLAVAIVLVLFMHIMAPPIASGDAPPAGHPTSLCIACHIVTGTTGEVEQP